MDKFNAEVLNNAKSDFEKAMVLATLEAEHSRNVYRDFLENKTSIEDLTPEGHLEVLKCMMRTHTFTMELLLAYIYRELSSR